MRIYFCRHGESQANLAHEISNRGLRHPLTRSGRAQAHALAERLKDEQITYIYSSPVLRAIETTVILANRLEVDYALTEALREFDCGEAEGRSDAAAWQQWHGVVEAWLEQRRYDQRIPGGECFDDIRQRFVPFVQELVQRYRESQAHVLCVAHGGLYMSMLPLVLANVDQARVERLGINYTTCIVCEPRPEGLVCVDWDGVQLEA